MTSSWDLETGQDKTDFTKFPVGVTRIRVLSPAPHQRFTHWMQQFQRSVTCPGRTCPIDVLRKKQKDAGVDQTYNMSKKYAFNVYNLETGKVEVMEQGIRFVTDLKDVMQDLKDERPSRELKDVVLKVRRRGTGSEDTSYRIDVDTDASSEPMSSKEQKMFDEQLDLSEYFTPHTPEQINALLAVSENFKEAWIEIIVKSEETSDEGLGEQFDTE
jgi:hypothetical protein